MCSQKYDFFCVIGKTLCGIMTSWEGRIPSGEVIKRLPQGFMRLLVAWDTLVRRDPGDGDFDTVSFQFSG